jgi:hypothetical protein
MRLHLLRIPALALVLAIGCSDELREQLGVVTSEDLAGTYTGVLEGVTVADLEDLDDPGHQVVVDLDLLHEVTIRETGTFTLTIQSSLVPPVRAIVLGAGPVAVNAEFVRFEGLDLSHQDPRFEALEVKQIVFVRYDGEWVFVLQLVRVDVEPVDELYVYQYVSYPSEVADRMSNEEAIAYVNMILRLASSAQRHASPPAP